MADIRLVGKNLEFKHIAQSADAISKARKKAREEIGAEIQKTPEQLLMIDRFNQYLRQEFEELGLTGFSPIHPDQIHIRRHPAFTENIFVDYSGVAWPRDEKVIINKFADLDRVFMYKTILHEMIHLAAHLKIRAKWDGNKKEGEHRVYRSGYMTGGGGDSKKDYHGHFRGFNEAVVETITREILNKHWGELRKDFKFSAGCPFSVRALGKGAGYKGYFGYRKIFDYVTLRVAERRGLGLDEVVKKMKQGEMTGEMMHLRDIERTFGPGSLRVVAALGSGMKTTGMPRWAFPHSITTRLVMEYLRCKDPQEKERIANIILNKRERAAYGKYREVAGKLRSEPSKTNI